MTRARADRAPGEPGKAPADGGPRRDPHEAAPILPAALGNRQRGRLAKRLSREPETKQKPAKSVSVYLMSPPPRPGPPEALKRATPENRGIAELIDTLDTLDDAALRKVREQAAAAAVAPGGGKEQPAQELKLEALEFLAARRRIAPLSQKSNSSPTARRLYVRTLIQEGISDPTLKKQTGGSFKKSLAAFTHTKEIETDVEFFEKQYEDFGKEFTRQARATALKMLDGSLNAMGSLLASYGLPGSSTLFAAQNVYKGASLDSEADSVIKVAAKGKDVDAPAHVAHRKELADEVKNLQNQQLLVQAAQKRLNDAVNDAPYGGQEGPKWDRVRDAKKDLAETEADLQRYWIQAENKHPILAAYRRGGDIKKVDLGTLGRDVVQTEMKAVVLQVIPKIVDIIKVKNLITLGPKNHGISPLALGPVVALTKANMFIPDGSLRAGMIKDLVDEAADTEAAWIKVAAVALAILTLVPSGGTSLGIVVGAASASFAAYSAAEAWREYDTSKSLANTDLDLARSLSTEEPSLSGFAVSLVSLGIEALPLVHAFATARKIKLLMNEGKNVDELVMELNRVGERSPARVKNLGEEAKAEAEAANRAEARAASHVPKAPHAPEPPSPKLKPPPRDPELPKEMAAIAYTDTKTLQADLVAELKQASHGVAPPNPDMAWVLEVLAESAPGTSTNWQLMKVLHPYYATVRSAEKEAEFAAYLYKTAAERGITPRRALQEYVAGATSPTYVKGDLTRAILQKDPPFVDLNFLPGDPHGRYTHLFQEGLIDFVHGRGEGRRLRQLIARSTGPPGVSRRDKECWETVWDAFFDDETGAHVNRPETLGPALQKFLGLPL
jgi:hypothetical protein